MPAEILVEDTRLYSAKTELCVSSSFKEVKASSCLCQHIHAGLGLSRLCKGLPCSKYGGGRGGGGLWGVEPSQSSLEPPLLDFNGYPVWRSHHASCLGNTHLSPVNTLSVSSGQTSIFIITSTLADL